MANRAMNAKLRRARAQARDAAAYEFTKPAYLLQSSKRELRAIAAAFDRSIVRRIPSKPARNRRIRSHGDATRRGSHPHRRRVRDRVTSHPSSSTRGFSCLEQRP